MTAPGRGLVARIRWRRGTFDLDVDVHVDPGETLALLGPNGAGKSSILDVIAGVADPAPGDRFEALIAVGTRTLTDTAAAIAVAPEHRRVGLVYQDHLLFTHLSVLDNVAFGPRSAGRSRSESRADALSTLDRVGATELAHRAPRELSGGQAQRIAIARTLASAPAVLLLDEPLAALDVSARREVRRMLGTHLTGLEIPSVIVTHDPTDAFVLADRIAVVEAGRVVQVGTPDEIRRRPTSAYVAALGGTNLFGGSADGGSVVLDDHPHTVTVADRSVRGPVVVTIHPQSVSLHPTRPEGSQRNVWRSTIDLVEPLGDTVRVTLAEPVPMCVDVTPGAVESLGLAAGVEVWAAVKATEITVTPA